MFAVAVIEFPRPTSLMALESNPRSLLEQSPLDPAVHSRVKAGDGNRTHVACLEGRYSTIELHPRFLRTRADLSIRILSIPFGIDMGGAGFEPAKALPPDLQSGPFGRLGIHPFQLRSRIAAGSEPRGFTSHRPEQSWRRDSNSQPSVYKTDALPIELRQQPGP